MNKTDYIEVEMAGLAHQPTETPPSANADVGARLSLSIRHLNRHARKRSPNEFIPQLRDPIGAPSRPDGSLRGRFGPPRYGKPRASGGLQGRILFDGTMRRKVPLRPLPLSIDSGRSARSTVNRPADGTREKASLLLLAFSPLVGCGFVLSETGAKKEMKWTSRYSCTEPARLVKTSEQGGHAESVSLGNVMRGQGYDAILCG
jgi:hypothetical protein